MIKEREQWTSRMGFIIAAAGSAIGLGNIWGFPFLVGTHGGAAFVAIYLVVVVLMGYPLKVTEFAMGRETQKGPVGAFKALAPGAPWWVVGGMSVLVAFVIMGFYSIIGGWALTYITKSITGFVPGMDFGAIFGALLANPTALIVGHAVFMVLTAVIVLGGVVKGIQRWVGYMMPALFILLLILILRGITLPGAGAGFAFYLMPDFSAITAKAVLAAIGQAFFSLSLAMGIMVTYGSYVSKKEILADSAGWTVFLDTGIAFLAGFAIFPAVFALGFDPAGGGGLAFVVLPAVFAAMPFAGSFFAFLFFLLLSVAALTSSVSLTEVVIAWAMDEKGWDRRTAAPAVVVAIFILGIPVALGYNIWSGVMPLGMSLFSFYFFLTFTFALPLGGLLTAIFAGYVWTARKAQAAINEPPGRINIGEWYGFLLKYVIPIVVAIVWVMGLVEQFS